MLVVTRRGAGLAAACRSIPLFAPLFVLEFTVLLFPLPVPALAVPVLAGRAVGDFSRARHTHETGFSHHIIQNGSCLDKTGVKQYVQDFM